MISYAVKGGSVGPHTDAYDVFLLQAEGQRHWSISNTEKNSSILDGIDIRILKSFTAEMQWTLNPGDMLYLPPNVAHHGVAVDECITCSIGFRSPTVHTLISEYAESIAATLPEDSRYTDENISQQNHPAEITQESINRIKKILIDNLQISDEFIQKWFGEHITESNSPIQINRPDNTEEIKHLDELRDVTTFTRAPSIKFLYSHFKDNTLVFVDGQSFETSLLFAKALCSSHTIDANYLLESLQTEADEITLLKLLSLGYLSCDEDF